MLSSYISCPSSLDIHICEYSVFLEIILGSWQFLFIYNTASKSVAPGLIKGYPHSLLFNCKSYKLNTTNTFKSYQGKQIDKPTSAETKRNASRTTHIFFMMVSPKLHEEGKVTCPLYTCKRHQYSVPPAAAGLAVLHFSTVRTLRMHELHWHIIKCSCSQVLQSIAVPYTLI